MEVNFLVVKFALCLTVSSSVDEKGQPYRSSLLREVQTKAKDEDEKRRLTTQSQAHENMIKALKERKTVCEQTIRVIEETNSKLND